MAFSNHFSWKHLQRTTQSLEYFLKFMGSRKLHSWFFHLKQQRVISVQPVRSLGMKKVNKEVTRERFRLNMWNHRALVLCFKPSRWYGHACASRSPEAWWHLITHEKKYASLSAPRYFGIIEGILRDVMSDYNQIETILEMFTSFWTTIFLDRSGNKTWIENVTYFRGNSP